MKSDVDTRAADEAGNRIEATIDRVLARGFDDVVQNEDDYFLLIQKREWRELTVLQIYDGYFPPPRHEFEYEIIQHIVRAVIDSTAAEFIAKAVAAGVVGRAAWEVLRGTVVAARKRLHGYLRGEPFAEIQRTVDGLETFFKRRRQATIEEISEAIGVEGYRIEPLLRLLGFKCRRRKQKRVWCRRESPGN